MARNVTEYCPPPSGKSRVYWPFSFVVRTRVVPSSTDITSTRACATGRFSVLRTVPVMIP